MNPSAGLLSMRWTRSSSECVETRMTFEASEMEQPLREVETVLVAEVDVDERHVRTELHHESNRLGAVGRNPDDVQPLTVSRSTAPSTNRELSSTITHFTGTPQGSPIQIPVRIPASNPFAWWLASRDLRQLRLDRQRGRDLRPVPLSTVDTDRAASASTPSIRPTYEKRLADYGGMRRFSHHPGCRLVRRRAPTLPRSQGPW